MGSENQICVQFTNPARIAVTFDPQGEYILAVIHIVTQLQYISRQNPLRQRGFFSDYISCTYSKKLAICYSGLQILMKKIRWDLWPSLIFHFKGPTVRTVKLKIYWTCHRGTCGTHGFVSVQNSNATPQTPVPRERCIITRQQLAWPVEMGHIHTDWIQYSLILCGKAERNRVVWYKSHSSF